MFVYKKCSLFFDRFSFVSQLNLKTLQSRCYPQEWYKSNQLLYQLRNIYVRDVSLAFYRQIVRKLFTNFVIRMEISLANLLQGRQFVGVYQMQIRDILKEIDKCINCVG